MKRLTGQVAHKSLDVKDQLSEPALEYLEDALYLFDLARRGATMVNSVAARVYGLWNLYLVISIFDFLGNYDVKRGAVGEGVPNKLGRFNTSQNRGRLSVTWHVVGGLIRSLMGSIAATVEVELRDLLGYDHFASEERTALDDSQSAFETIETLRVKVEQGQHEMNPEEA